MSANTLAKMNITAETISAYDKRIPRYTSYPTPPFWTTEFTAKDWAEHLRSNSESDKPLSLYVHIPFCAKRCLFCACNVIITSKDWVADEYLDMLEREISVMSDLYKGSGRVIQLHLGGGTPNFLDHSQMARLLKMLESKFDFDPEAERSIEVDPRIATPEDVVRLYNDHRFRRISFGTQDFNEETQLAIGREQTLDITFANVQAARDVGFKSINLDLIYGLPKQTEQSWSETLDAVGRLRPDRIALYNFAYLPALLSHQRSIEEADLPAPENKLAMFIESHNQLTTAGWEFIGMDHYALREDSLVKAQREGTLRRNFMGYTTLRGTNMLSLGVSSISDFEGVFAQNVKKLTTWRKHIEAGRLPVERGLKLSDDDRFRRHIIEELMCNGVLRFDATEPFSGQKIHDLVDAEMESLTPLINDDLIVLSDKSLLVTPRGRVFLRNIASVFDSYLKRKMDKPLFSRAV